MKITTETQSKQDAVDAALFNKIIQMINTYISDIGISPIVSLDIDSIIFTEDFQKELEKNIPAHERSILVLIQRLKLDALNNQNNQTQLKESNERNKK